MLSASRFPVAAVIVLEIFIGITGSLNAEEGLKVSQRAPAFILKTLDGSEVIRSKDVFSEKKLTVLIFWDSYCPECLKAVANCQKFCQNSGELDVSVWSINFDRENLSKVRSFVKGEGITFPILSDPLGVTAGKYKTKAYDFSFFIIDKGGIIRYVCYDHPPDVADVIRKEVERLLEGKLRVSEPAPSFALKTLDESKVVQSEKVFSQRELTVLIFWNSRRKECLDAIVECQKLYRKLEKLNVGFLSVSFDEVTEKTKAFVKEQALTFPILSDIRGIAAKSYKVSQCHCFAVFIVDEKGVIRYISYEPPPNVAEVIETQVAKLRMENEKETQKEHNPPR